MLGNANRNNLGRMSTDSSLFGPGDWALAYTSLSQWSIGLVQCPNKKLLEVEIVNIC